MAAIGSLVFCTDCGNLLPATRASENRRMKCECCGAWNRDTGAKTIVTKSKPSDFPSFLRQKLHSNVQSVERHKIQTETSIRERCRSCGREEVKFTAVQLRGADEGSTIIFSCECGNSWHENN